MSISATDVKELREKTGAGISDIKKAFEQSRGDAVKAEEIIIQKLGLSAGKRAGRETNAGLVEAYIHSNARVGAMVELSCETDFVSRNQTFKQLGHDLAMQVAAMRPVWVSFDDIPSDVRDLFLQSTFECCREIDTHLTRGIEQVAADADICGTLERH